MLIETVLYTAGIVLYTWISDDLAKKTDESFIKSSLGGLPTEILGSTTDRLYEMTKRKIRERFPGLIRENKKTLMKAVRKAQLKAIHDVCAAYRLEIDGTPSESYDLQYIKAVEKYTYAQEKLLSRENFAINDQSFTDPTVDEKSVNTQITAIQKSLFGELPKADTLPVRFKDMMENGWTQNNRNINLFQRINAHFAEELRDAELANLFHTHLIKNLSFTLNDLVEGQVDQTAKIDELRIILEERTADLERLGYRILYEGGKRSGIEFIGEKLDYIAGGIDDLKIAVAQINERAANPPDDPQTAYGLPNLNKQVYGRDEEKDALLKTLCGETDKAKLKKFALLVAPSGFGKTFVLQKALQDVYDEENKVIQPNYQAKVKRILFIDCRNKKTLSEIVADFNVLLAAAEQYDETIDPLNIARRIVQLSTDKVWLIFDNFESWLDKDYRLIDAGLRAFLHALFETDHNLRGVFISQSEPESHFQNKLNELETIGKELLNGLPEDIAIEYLKTEGQDVGLDKVDESLLKEFLKRVARIPQALPSLVDYLRLKQTDWEAEDRTFADFINDTKLWESFDKYEEHQAEDIHIRRTKALIKAQIEAQSDDIKLIIKAITFFDREVSYQGLKLLFDDEDQGVEAVRRFREHKIAFERKGIRKTPYYDLHAYFREVARRVLSPVEAIATYQLVVKFLNKGLSDYQATYFNRSITLTECAEKILVYLINSGHKELINDLAGTYMNKGISLRKLGRLDEAILEYNKAIDLRESLVKAGSTELADDLATAYMNKGVSLRNLGRLDEAILELDNSINIFESLMEAGHTELADNLPAAYMNKGNLLANLGSLNEAILEYNKAIEIFEPLVEAERTEFANNLAGTYMNKGVSLRKLGRLDEAILEYNKAIDLRESLMKAGSTELADDLAGTYINKGVSLRNLGRLDEAILEYNKAIKILKSLVEAGRTEVANDLAMAYMNKGVPLRNLGKLNDAILELDNSIEIFESLMEAGRLELANDLAMAYMNKGSVLEQLNELVKAVEYFSEAIDLWRNQRQGEFNHLPNYVKALWIRVGSLIKLENWQAVAIDAVQVMMFMSIFESDEFSDEFKGFVGQEIGLMFWRIKELSPENQAKVYEEANLIGQQQEEPEPFGDILKQYVDGME